VSDKKQQEDWDAAKKAADKEESEAHITPADVKSSEEKLLAFATGLNPAERKHLWTLLDKAPEGDVQGYWWRDTWRVRWWHGGWGWRHWR